MFGTIGHARLKSGHRAQLDGLMDDWLQTIRPQIPGEFINLVGNVEGQPDEVVFVALAQDQATYRRLAEMPEQDAWYRRFTEHVEGEVRWEDVAMEVIPA